MSIGGIQPGVLFLDGKLSTWYGITWNIWVIGETGLGSSPIVDILAMLNQHAASITTVPAVPAGLAGTAWETGLELNWNSSLGATSYKIKRSTTSGSGYETIAAVSSLSYTDTTAVSGTRYYYVVSAANPFGESANSNEVSLKLISNLALGKLTAASSTQGSNTPDKAVDGIAGSRWESHFSDPQWWGVNLGGVYTINRIRIRWEHAAAKEYTIDVSTEGSTGPWTTVYSTTTGSGGTELLTIPPVNARYVKMSGITRNNPVRLLVLRI
jgi:beta-galactosidase